MPPRAPNVPIVLPNGVSILPRQPGESRWEWRNRRSYALYGKSEYQRRVESGRARGMTTAEAGGHPNVGGLTDYQLRRQRTMERTGFTPSQLRYQQMDSWLAANGYTPQTTNRSQTWLRRNYTALKWIKDHSHPSGTIEPGMIAEAADMEATGALDRGWSEYHLQERYRVARIYHDQADNQPGNFYWFNDKPNFEGLTANWWYYH